MKKKVVFEFLNQKDGSVYAILSKKYRRGYKGNLTVKIGQTTSNRSVFWKGSKRAA